MSLACERIVSWMLSTSHVIEFLSLEVGTMANMENKHANDPLHGVTLVTILNHLVEQYGWDELGERIPIKCFTNDPSIKSSLKFLRRTPWARKKVEDLYLKTTR